MLWAGTNLAWLHTKQTPYLLYCLLLSEVPMKARVRRMMQHAEARILLSYGAIDCLSSMSHIQPHRSISSSQLTCSPGVTACFLVVWEQLRIYHLYHTPLGHYFSLLLVLVVILTVCYSAVTAEKSGLFIMLCPVGHDGLPWSSSYLVFLTAACSLWAELT